MKQKDFKLFSLKSPTIFVGLKSDYVDKEQAPIINAPFNVRLPVVCVYPWRKQQIATF